MKFIDKVLQEPSYKWCNENGTLSMPSPSKLYREAFSRINIFKSIKNWMNLINWLVTICMMPFLLLFIFKYFSFLRLAIAVVYGIVIMAVHSTVWHHRFCTHRSYTFSNSLWKFLIQNLVIRTFPEEIYVISHHVHHARSDQPGDPYNSKAGFLYCMLADVNHQSISKNLNRQEYAMVVKLLKHTGIWLNSYAGYLKWGSATNILYVIILWLLNWICWYSIFFIMGGHGIACALFGAAMLWFILVRAFNFTGHAGGKEKHIEGVDFDRRNLSVNQLRPGLICGEWHNNHHLYPHSARAGFLPYQLDISWLFILLLFRIGAVSFYHNHKKDFLNKYIYSSAQ